MRRFVSSKSAVPGTPFLIVLCSIRSAVFSTKIRNGQKMRTGQIAKKKPPNVVSQYCTNRGKRNWEKLDAKLLKFHISEDQLASCQEAQDEISSPQNDLEEYGKQHMQTFRHRRNSSLMKCRTLCPMK